MNTSFTHDPYQYYPTPASVISLMLKPYKSDDIEGMYILEPSAGEGHILEYINKMISRNTYHDAKHKHLFCCEIHPDRRFTLQQKGFNVVGDDFLKYHGHHVFDLVIMNPPFNDAVDHILHAWSLVENADIVSLINSSTLSRTDESKVQHLTKLIAEHGSVETLSDKAFYDAERKANVTPAIIRLKKITKRHKLDFDDFTNQDPHRVQFDDNMIRNEVATLDVVGNMMLNYEKVRKAFIEMVKARHTLLYYGSAIALRRSHLPQPEKYHIDNPSSPKNEYNEFITTINEVMWMTVMDRLGMERYMTANVKRNFEQFRKQQGALDFNRDNVRSLIRMMLANGEQILEQAIVDVFNMFTEHHRENHYLVTGWKTNGRYKVNRKVILPYMVELGWSGKYQRATRRWDEYSDIERVMSYITGEQPDVSLSDVIKEIRIGTTGWTPSFFFDIRCFKKGTIHLYFRDEWLWKEFNMRACAQKKWLPTDEEESWKKREYVWQKQTFTPYKQIATQKENQ